jgi:ribonuclease Z
MLLRRAALALLLSAPLFIAAQTGVSRTQVILLGTGTPYPDPARSGPAVEIVVNGTPYLVDCGPGVVRRATSASEKVSGASARNIHTLFLTHLHSDHTTGLPDIMFTPSVVGRRNAMEIYGPRGTTDMVSLVQQAWAKDMDVRLHGLERGHPDAYVYHSHEIKPGVVYEDANVTVTAFAVKHGSWDESLGYRFDTPDRSIVISGDTRPSEIAAVCNGCDLLLHEVYPQAGLLTQPEGDREYHRQFHTSTAELAKIAGEAKPKTLVLYHVLYWGVTPDGVLRELTQAGYTGKAVVANDLDIF